LSKISDAACSYVEQGLAVYPADTNKKALIRGWNGASAARDPARAERMFAEFPAAQLGIATGPSGLVVIDIDPRNGGEESFRLLCGKVGLEAFESCAVALTPSGGRHLYFASSGRYRSRAHALGRGIDIVGERGGVLAPPSDRCGSSYRWSTSAGEEPDLSDLPELPATLADQLNTSAITAQIREIGAMIPKGKRNDTLMRFGSKLRWRFKMSGDELQAALIALNHRCAPPLSESEVAMIATSVAQRAARIIDPVEWLAQWIPHLGGAREVRVASALAAWADFTTGEFTPIGESLEEKTGLRLEKYYIARRALEERGAIHVTKRGRNLAPAIHLLPVPTDPDSRNAKPASLGTRKVAA
jgi:hypothetical protein